MILLRVTCLRLPAITRLIFSRVYVSGLHGVVTRSIRGYDTRKLKLQIVAIVGRVLGGLLLSADLERIVCGGTSSNIHQGPVVNTAALEKFLLASKVIDQFGVVKVKCLPHDCLMYVRKHLPPAAEQLLEESIDRGAPQCTRDDEQHSCSDILLSSFPALTESTTALERIMGLTADNGSTIIDQLAKEVLEAVAMEAHASDRVRVRSAEEAHTGGTISTETVCDVVRNTVERMCIGSATAATPRPPHTARRQTRKYVKTKRKREQEVVGPVRSALDSFFADTIRLVAAMRSAASGASPLHHEVETALDDVLLALPASYKT